MEVTVFANKLSWFPHLSHLWLVYLSIHISQRPVLPVLLFISGYSMSFMTERNLVCSQVRSYWKGFVWGFCFVLVFYLWGSQFFKYRKWPWWFDRVRSGLASDIKLCTSHRSSVYTPGNERETKTRSRVFVLSLNLSLWLNTTQTHLIFFFQMS